LAHETEYIPFLLGIGIRTLSLYPKFLPVVQNLITGLKISETKVYAKRLLAENTIGGVRQALKRLS
jgi:phosphotransferase system enzyme I (PtsP)